MIDNMEPLTRIELVTSSLPRTNNATTYKPNPEKHGDLDAAESSQLGSELAQPEDRAASGTGANFADLDSKTKEEVYDSLIEPLMRRILAICKARRITVIADFGLDADLHCTSAVLEDDCEPSDSQLSAFELLGPKRHFSLAITIQDVSR